MKVSVVIVTRNRASHLRRCLQILAKQSAKLDELLVVDNDSEDDTQHVVRSYQDKVRFPVRIVAEKSLGFPAVYNRGIREAKYDWVAFIDDDCLATSEWLVSVKKALEKHPLAAAILGKSITQQSTNLFALLTQFSDEYWKRNQIGGDRVLDLEILDNKNIVYNRAFMKKNRVWFNESLIPFFNGACEDSDLGMQIQHAGGTAFFAPEMVVRHADPNRLGWYYKKLIVSTQAHDLYERRWSAFRSRLSGTKKINSLRLFLEYQQRYNLSLFFSLQFLFHLYFSYLLVQGVKAWRNVF